MSKGMVIAEGAYTAEERAAYDNGYNDASIYCQSVLAGHKAAHTQCDAELAKTYHDSLLAKNARELAQVRAELAAALAHVTELEQAVVETRNEAHFWREHNHSTLAEVNEARAHLKAEQDAGTKLMNRFCKALGPWEGCWDNAVEARLKAQAEGCDCPGNCPHCGLEIA